MNKNFEILFSQYFVEKDEKQKEDIIKLIDIVILMKNILEVLDVFEDNLGENKINLETLTETSFRQTSCNFFNKLRKSWSSFTKQVLTSLTTENINVNVLLGKMFNVYRFLSFGMFYNLEINKKSVENFERIL